MTQGDAGFIHAPLHPFIWEKTLVVHEECLHGCSLQCYQFEAREGPERCLVRYMTWWAFFLFRKTQCLYSVLKGCVNETLCKDHAESWAVGFCCDYYN